MAGTSYNGLNANVTLPTGVAILSSTVGNPTTFQTAAPHNLLSGDYVNIYGHTVNTVGNCVSQPVTVVDATHFTVPVNTLGGTNGGNTGHVYPSQFTNNVGLNPANGDPLSAATWVPGMSCTQDRTTALVARASPLKIFTVGSGNIHNNANPFTTPWFSMSGITPAAYTPVLLSGSPITWIVAANPDICVATVDSVEVQLDWSASVTGNGGAAANSAFALFYSFVPVGSAASYNIVGGSQKLFNFPTATIQTLPITNAGFLQNGSTNQLTLPGGNTVGNLSFQLWVNTNGANNTIQGQADYMLTCRVYRTTGAPL